MIWLAGAALVAGLVVALFKVFMYAALASIPLSSFAGELGQNVGKSVLKSYAAVCLEGTVISGMEGPPPRRTG